MPLPTKKSAPKANPGASAPSTAQSKGKSRLPALPQGGLKAPKSYQYIDLPKDQERGFYLVKLVKADVITREKKNLDSLLLEFAVCDTDCRGVRAGSTVSSMHDLQGDASLYFWKEVSPVIITLAGGEVSDETLVTFMEDYEASYAEFLEGGAIGSIARVNLRRVMLTKDKDGNLLEKPKARVYKDWEPATDEELAKYTEAAAE